MSAATEVEDLLRELAPQVLGALVRRYGGFDTCEEAVQETLLAAAVQWPTEGLPGGWRSTAAPSRQAGLRRPSVSMVWTTDRSGGMSTWQWPTARRTHCGRGR